MLGIIILVRRYLIPCQIRQIRLTLIHVTWNRYRAIVIIAISSALSSVAWVYPQRIVASIVRTPADPTVNQVTFFNPAQNVLDEGKLSGLKQISINIPDPQSI